MKILEYEAKKLLKEAGIPVPAGVLISSPGDLPSHLADLPESIVLKAQVDVGGRGKAGGILKAQKQDAVRTAEDLFGRTIKQIPVREVLVEEQLEILHEYYLSIAIDRSSKQAL